MAEEKKKEKAAAGPADAQAAKKEEAKSPKPASKDEAPKAAKATESPAKSQAAGKDDDKAPKKKSKKEADTFAAYTDGEADRSTIKVPVLSLDAKELRSIHLPKVFAEPVRFDLIARAVQASRANRRQPYGAPAEGVWAGRRHSTEWSGKGHGISRVQRLKQGNGAATSPNNVGGARAHPPRAVAKRWEKINVKERRKARRSALAAVAREDLVRARGHHFDDGVKVPVIVESKFEALWREARSARDDEGRVQATKALVAALENLGLGPDLARARDGTHQRAGRGKMRGRRFRVPRSVLIVASNDRELARCARNVPGVEVVSPKRLSTESLAPGGSPGRLTIITETALGEIKGLR